MNAINAIEIYKKRSLAVVPAMSRAAQIQRRICRLNEFSQAMGKMTVGIGRSEEAFTEYTFQRINQELNYKYAHPFRYSWLRLLGKTLLPSPFCGIDMDTTS